MPTAFIRLLATALALGVATDAAQPALAAGPMVRLVFSGTNTSGQAFVGCLQYDSSLTKTGPYYFDFTGIGLNHEICYQTSTGLQGAGDMGNCEPFYIHTSLNSDKTFQLTATQPKTVTVTITIPASSGVTFGPNTLPVCKSGGPDPFSTSSGTFTLANATTGTVLFTGTIASVTCSQPAVGSDCTCPPIAVVQGPPVYFASYSTPAPSTVYACPPRRGCCLTRLFARVCHRNGCW